MEPPLYIKIIIQMIRERKFANRAERKRRKFLRQYERATYIWNTQGLERSCFVDRVIERH